MMMSQPSGGEWEGNSDLQEGPADWKGKIVSDAAAKAQAGGLDTLTDDYKEHMDRNPTVRDTVWEQQLTRMTCASIFTPQRT